MKLAALLMAAWPIFAQPTFDVASVKPAAGGPPGPAPLANGQLHARGATLSGLLYFAYQTPIYQISGEPGWGETERYDIDAKAEKPTTTAETRVMLQGLLADRFHLKIHREMKDVQAYVLVVANGKTHKMTVADSAGCEVEPSATNPCQHMQSRPPGMVLAAERLSMPLFAKALGSMFHDAVIDKTGLDGVYSFTLDLGRAGFTPTPGSPTNEMDGMNAMMSALQDQLGLKMERSKTTIEMLVIDHVEKPTAN